MKLAVIGFGHMGSAIVQGALRAGVIATSDVYVAEKDYEARERAEKLGLYATGDISARMGGADIVLLAVKPQDLAEVCSRLRGNLKKETVAVSICAGKKIEFIEDALGEAKIVRVMPNTPAAVGEGMSAVCGNKLCDDDDMKAVLKIFRCFGKAEIVPENLFDVVTAVSGSGPAYVYSFIAGLKNYAVSAGMNESAAVEFSAQTVLGAAKMVIESGLTVNELKKNICTPNGTTVEAVKVLDGRGFESIVADAARACEKRSAELGK